jgi:hypothetical protein
MNENTIREAPHSLEISVGAKGQVTATIKQYVAEPIDLVCAMEHAAALLAQAAATFPTFTLDGSLAAAVDDKGNRLA